MRSKTPLVLMEQMIMLLVFALAAALCLQAFVKSDQMSQRSEDRDRAVVLCQNAAELLQANQGDFSAVAAAMGVPHPYPGYEDDDLLLIYDANWKAVEDPAEGAFCIRVSLLPPQRYGMGRAIVSPAYYDFDNLEALTEFLLPADITVAWQEDVRVHWEGEVRTYE